MKVRLYIFLFLILLVKTTIAQSFVAEVNANRISTDDQLQVSFTFYGKNVNDVKNFQAPNFKGFQVLMGPSLSTMTQYVNGVVSASKGFTYYLKPLSPGKIIIGSASITYNGNPYKTKPIDVEVVKGSVQPQKQQQDNTQYEDVSDDIFMRATVDKNTVYNGEQVTLTYKLYSRLRFAANMSISKLPFYQGFWTEEIETPQRIQFNTEVYNGKQYMVGTLKKAALFPNQSGKLKLLPFEITVPVEVRKKRQNRSNDPFERFFDDSFFGMTETVEQKIRSNEITINVLPLPDKNVPASFKGAVGEFTLKSTLDKKQPLTNEPLILKLEIAGQGNIKLIETPELHLSTGIDQYDPKESEDIVKGEYIAGTKIIEYYLVPRTIGEKTIPSIEFSYFDPSQKKYVTLSSPEYPINVQKGNKEYVDNNTEELGNDIKGIKDGETALKLRGSYIFNNPAYWLSGVLPALALAFFVIKKRKYEKFRADIVRFKYTQAEKIARKKLKNAEILMKNNDPEGFYTEISQALYGYLEDKFHINQAEFTLEKALNLLEENKIADSIRNEVKDSIEKCEFIRFAPHNNGISEMNNMYNRFTHIIISIEGSLN
ncbi:MAG TPA: BatD family protein [Ignavibacteriaceae bacterium]|nr:BatD family protein [Ignavibacteriaceae bacterium]